MKRTAARNITLAQDLIIHKLLLIHARYGDSRRETIFDRGNDDWNQVQGLLKIEISPQ